MAKGFIKNKIIIFVRNWSKNAIFILFGVFLFFVIMEIGLRAYENICFGIPFFKSANDYQDVSLGWKGKKIFGDFASKKYKIFIIGDSFTDGCGVEEASMYYNVFKDKLNAELFVYGGGGYGTLQEFLVLDKYYDQIQPDLILLQVCPNDFINNSWELESRSYINNNQMVRPYFRNGNIEYLFPRIAGRQRMFLGFYSRAFYRLFNLFEKFNAVLVKKRYLGTVEHIIRREGVNYKNFRSAVIVTDILVKKIKDKAARTPIVAFVVDDAEPYLNEFRTIFKENQIPFIDRGHSLITSKEKTGVCLRLKNESHWNADGHQIVGNFLADELYRSGYHK